MPYVWDDHSHVLRRADYESLDYTDGAAVEERLYEVVRSSTDRSSLSPELAASISDWPSEYHLSRLRHCLIRPLAIEPGHSVLELGCGCGAITRYLGEIGAEVVAVEGSLARARIAAERCRDLPKVKVVADDLLSFESPEQFQWILLIGVLEYAPKFGKGPDPILAYLRSVRRFLEPRGKLIVAIENKLGLKYFNGAGEDHFDAPFIGIQDLYFPGAPCTFSRRELIQQLAAAGLSYCSIQYPFPDYKLPNVILSEAGLKDESFDFVDLLARCHARDYAGSPYRCFDDALAFRALAKADLVEELSNSFLVVASAEPASQPVMPELAFTFSAKRAPHLATQTRFLRQGPEIVVLKEPLVKREAPPSITIEGATFTSELGPAVYRRGRQVLWNLLEARARNGSLESVMQALKPWITFLWQHAYTGSANSAADGSTGAGDLASYVMPGDFLDCTPFNLLQVDDELVFIDQEWLSADSIPLGWVLTRGILWALGSGVPAHNPLQSIFEVVNGIASGMGCTVDPSNVAKWLAREAVLQRIILGFECSGIEAEKTSSGARSFVSTIAELTHDLRTAAEMRERLDRRVTELATESTAQRHRADVLQGRVVELEANTRNLEAGNRALQLALADVRNKLNSVLQSSSWKLTAPMRALRKAVARVSGGGEMFEERELIARSGMFDVPWYLANCPEAATTQLDPILHYLEIGADEGRDPSPQFSSSGYLRQNPDVAAGGINPLVHYLKFGRAEGRQIIAFRSGGKLDAAVQASDNTSPSDEPSNPRGPEGNSELP